MKSCILEDWTFFVGKQELEMESPRHAVYELGCHLSFSQLQSLLEHMGRLLILSLQFCVPLLPDIFFPLPQIPQPA